MQTDKKPLLTTAAVAKWFGVSPRTVCLWAEFHELPAIKVGRQWRFREHELRAWLEDPKRVRGFTPLKATTAGSC